MPWDALCQQHRVWDASRAFFDGMANVGIDPNPNIDIQALLDPMEEQSPLLCHLRGIECRNESAIYEMMLDFHVLVKIL